MSDNTAYFYTDFTGGGTDALDSLDGAGLSNGDMAIVQNGGNTYHYTLDSGSGETENSPYIIRPDTNYGNKRWILQGITGYTTDYEWFPIENSIDGDSAPSAVSAYSPGTAAIKVRRFDGASSKDVRFTWKPPEDLYTSGDIKYRVKCVVTEATAPSSGEGVSFKMAGRSFGHGDSISAGVGTEYESKTGDLESGLAQYDTLVTSWSNAMSICALVAGEFVNFKFYRDHDDADDDYGSAVGVAGVDLQFKRIITY